MDKKRLHPFEKIQNFKIFHTVVLKNKVNAYDKNRLVEKYEHNI